MKSFIISTITWIITYSINLTTSTSLQVNEASFTLTPDNPSSPYSTLTLIQNNTFNSIDTFNNTWQCNGNRSQVSFCLMLDLSTPGITIHTINLTIDGSRITSESDLFTTFSSKHNNKYFTMANDWDGALHRGDGTNYGGVLVAPSCSYYDNTINETIYTQNTEIFELDPSKGQSTMLDLLQGEEFVNNSNVWLDYRAALSGGNITNMEVFTGAQRNGDTRPVRISMVNDFVSDRIIVGFESDTMNYSSCIMNGTSFGRSSNEMTVFITPDHDNEQWVISSINVSIAWITTAAPTNMPSTVPTNNPTSVPSSEPSDLPSKVPSGVPSNEPSAAPSDKPTILPSSEPSGVPSEAPSNKPSDLPTVQPTEMPSDEPTVIMVLESTESPRTSSSADSGDSDDSNSSSGDDSDGNDTGDSSDSSDTSGGDNGKSTSTTNDTIFSNSSDMTLLFIVIIFCLLCCVICLLAVMALYWFRKHRKMKKIQNNIRADSLRSLTSANSATATLNSNNSNNKDSLVPIPGASAAMVSTGAIATNALFSTNGRRNNNNSGSGIDNYKGGELEMSNVASVSNNNNNSNVGDGDEDLDISDLINVKLGAQPAINANYMVTPGDGGGVGGENDDMGGEGRNMNETTMIVNNRGGNINNGGNMGGNMSGNNGRWEGWDSSTLMEYLRREMLACNLNEEQCNVFLSDLSDQGINGAMVKILKENKNFQDQLQTRMQKHALAIWMVFQVSLNNLK